MEVGEISCLVVTHRAMVAIPVKVRNLFSVGAALCRDLEKIAPKRRSYRKVALLTK
jgi:hypothetical protein